MTTAAQARPAQIFRDALPDLWEGIAYWYNHGPLDDSPVWRVVDALAPGLPEEQRNRWFEQLYSALAVRDGNVECPPGADPDRVEQTAAEAVDEAIRKLIGGAR